MTVSIFAVTYSKVRAHYFPQLSDFSGSTNPTSTTVGEMIDAEGARLAGALSKVGVSASTVSADAGATYPAAYAWCQDTLRLGAAVRVARAMSGTSAVSERWQTELDGRYEDLLDNGAVALGDAPTTAAASGPRSHIHRLGLDVGDDADASPLDTKFRRSDQL